MVLCESAVVREDGFLDMRGAGWQLHNPDFRTGEIGLIIEVPSDAEDGQHNLRVWMVKRIAQGAESVDGEPIWDLASYFTTRTTAGFIGAPKQGVKTCPMPPSKLEPYSRYTVRVAVDGESDPAWAQDFYTVGD